MHIWNTYHQVFGLTAKVLGYELLLASVARLYSTNAALKRAVAAIFNHARSNLERYVQAGLNDEGNSPCYWSYMSKSTGGTSGSWADTASQEPRLGGPIEHICSPWSRRHLRLMTDQVVVIDAAYGNCTLPCRRLLNTDCILCRLQPAPFATGEQSSDFTQPSRGM